MSQLRFAGDFRELVAYQKARHLSGRIFRASKLFPKEEMFSLTDQLRRSSRSIGAQIAEAWGKRRYERHFISKLTDADAEQYETQHWLQTAFDCSYLSERDFTELTDGCEEVGRLVNGMIVKANRFCSRPPSAVRESSEGYSADE